MPKLCVIQDDWNLNVKAKSFQQYLHSCMAVLTHICPKEGFIIACVIVLILFVRFPVCSHTNSRAHCHLCTGVCWWALSGVFWRERCSFLDSLSYSVGPVEWNQSVLTEDDNSVKNRVYETNSRCRAPSPHHLNPALVSFWPPDWVRDFSSAGINNWRRF